MFVGWGKNIIIYPSINQTLSIKQYIKEYEEPRGGDPLSAKDQPAPDELIV